MVITFVFLGYARCILLAVVIVNLGHWRWAQLLLTMYLCQAFLMFMVYYRMYKSRKEWVINILNETIIVLTVYHLYGFTDWIPDVHTRAMLGYSLVGMAAANAAINYAPLSHELSKHIKLLV